MVHRIHLYWSIYVPKRLLNVGHVLGKGVSMQNIFEEFFFLEKNKKDLN